MPAPVRSPWSKWFLGLACALVSTCSAADAFQSPPDSPASAPSVNAVGVLPCMPRPLAEDGDVSGLVSSLSLTDAQAVNLRALLKDYWSRWRAVQEAEFQTFAEQFRSVSAIPAALPKKSVVRAFISHKDRIRSTLQSIEHDLLVSIGGTLLQHQTPMLEDLRIKRDRLFLTADPLVSAWFSDRLPLDVHDLLASAAPQSQDITQAIEDGYNARSLQTLTELQKAVDQGRICWVDGIDRTTFVPFDLNGPRAQIREHLDAIHLWSGCLQDSARIATEQLALARKTIQDLCVAPPTSESRAIRAEYYITEFSQKLNQDCVLQWAFEEALHTPEIDEPTRSKISVAYERWLTKARPLQELIAGGLIARQITMPPSLMISLGPPRPEEERLRDTVLPLQECRNESEQVLRRLLSDDQMHDIYKRAYALHRRDGGPSVPSPIPLAAQAVEFEPPSAPTSDDLGAIAEVLDENFNVDDFNAILEPFILRYKNTIKQLRAAGAGLAPPELMDAEKTQSRALAWSDAVAQFRALDEQFFAALAEHQYSADALILVRLRRQIHLSRWMERACDSGVLGVPADFISVLASLPKTAIRRKMVSMTVEHAPQISELLNQDEHSLANFRQASLISYGSRWLRLPEEERLKMTPEEWLDDSRARVQLQIDSQQRQQDANQKMRANSTALMAALHDLSNELRDLEPEGAGWQVRLGSAESSFGNLLSDLGPARNRLQKAISLSTLAPAQRAALTQCAADFVTQSKDSLDDSIGRLWSYALTSSADDSLTVLQVEQLRIDQRRLGSEIDATLQRILNPGQLAMIGFKSAAD